MKVYVAGPMSGIADWNFPAFFRAASILQSLGHEPVNPADNDGPTLEVSLAGAYAAKDAGATWADYLKRDLPRLLPCDAVCVLPGWQRSKGASLEVDVAQRLGMPSLCLVNDALVPRVRAIGLSGYARAGKDTVGRILVEEHGYRRASFADKLRKVALAIDPVVDYEERLAAVVDLCGWETAKDSYPEVRRLLQRIGTEAGRNLIDDNLWVDLAFRALPDGARVVFTDCRFPNEAGAIKRAGGVVWRIVRPDCGPVNGHPSESALDDWPFDDHILNDSTLDDLAHEMREAVLALGPDVLPPRRCEWCSNPVQAGQDFCGETCRQAWYRDDRAHELRQDAELDALGYDLGDEADCDE